MTKIIGELNYIPKIVGCLHFRGNLCGELTPTDQRIVGDLAVAAQISGDLNASSLIEGNISVYKPSVDPSGDIYEGPYTVTPKAFRDVTLRTENKFMEKNVKVLEIPYYETSNLHGKTVIIGG